jgi:hypothetical protein
MLNTMTASCCEYSMLSEGAARGIYDVLQYLPGEDSPAEKEEVASTAESNNAPQVLITCWRRCRGGVSSKSRTGIPDTSLAPLAVPPQS